MLDYVKISLAGVFLLGAFASGWGLRNRDFNDYKQKVSNAAKTQEEKVKSIRSQQELVTKGIENEYEAKLSAIRNYYKSTSVWNNPNTSSVSSISAAPNVADVIASYNQLVSSCAETTQQIVSLQEWLNAQVEIK